jgi:hypothetical protein
MHTHTHIHAHPHEMYMCKQTRTCIYTSKHLLAPKIMKLSARTRRHTIPIHVSVLAA